MKPRRPARWVGRRSRTENYSRLPQESLTSSSLWTEIFPFSRISLPSGSQSWFYVHLPTAWLSSSRSSLNCSCKFRPPNLVLLHTWGFACHSRRTFASGLARCFGRSMASSGTMKFAPPNDAVDRDWISLRSKLWPGAESEHLREMATALALGLPVLLAIDAGGPAAGFVVAPMRVDFVNGTNS